MPGWTVRTDSAMNGVWRLLLRIAAVVAVIYTCYLLRAIITTLFVAAIIAYVLEPPVAWLCRRSHFVRLHSRLFDLLDRGDGRSDRVGAPRSRSKQAGHRRHMLRLIATIYVFILASILCWQGAVSIVTPFAREFRTASSPASRRQLAAQLQTELNRYDAAAPSWAKSDRLKQLALASDLPKRGAKVAADLAQRLAESVKHVVELVLLPVLAFYFLVDGRILKHEFVALAPAAWRRETVRIVSAFNRIMRAFVAGQFILCVLAGVIVGTLLALMGVQYPVILGVLAGLTRAIPIIGPIVGGIPIVLFALVNRNLSVALAVLVFFTLMHLAESKFVMPLLIGDKVDLHPVIIILVILIGGEMGGLLIGTQLGALLGMFFAAPIASLIRRMVRRYWLHLSPSGSRLGQADTVGPTPRSRLSVG